MKDKVRKLFSNVWTIPNVLTMIRLLLVPVFVVVYFRTAAEPKYAALAVFAAASLTDMLDGFLARKLNQITDFGKLFDPLADTLMVLTALVCQALTGVFPWTAVIVVACKELFMVIGGLFLLRRDVVVYSNMFGKAAQVSFILSLILSFFHVPLEEWGTRLDLILLWITVGLAILAMVVYAAEYLRSLKKPKE